jgi:malate/lactate dehydrogenase
MAIPLTSLSVPTIIGKAGAEKRIEIRLAAEEQAALEKSASVLRETIAQTGV